MSGLSQLPASTWLELTMLDHPSVFARLTTLCSRRAYRIEGMFCPPAREGAERSVWLLVHAKCSIDQIERQLHKLEDVQAVRCHGAEHPLLARLASELSPTPPRVPPPGDCAPQTTARATPPHLD